MEHILPSPQQPLPRPEYPRPQWVRENWYCLNGLWDFAFDFTDSGLDHDMVAGGEYPQKILVPFCPESRRSGIGFTDFIPAVWYRRNLHLDRLPDGRVLLHFGAVDYLSEIYVNSVCVGTHKGGYSAFALDITDALHEGDNTLVVHARDNVRSRKQPRGKQSILYASAGCDYTRTTGIWQTVWLEIVPERYLASAKMIPHASDGTLSVNVATEGMTDGDVVLFKAYYKGMLTAEASAHVSGAHAVSLLTVSDVHLWNPGAPELYDLEITLLDGKTQKEIDRISSYFALRDVSFTGRSLTINGKPCFMRTVLDQGFHPEGIYTALSDEDLKRDIQLSMDLGFNGARFHQRIFEDRSLYWADRLGYLVWAEFANGFDLDSAESLYIFLPEWMELVKQQFNHPSVIGWCPMNETYFEKVLDENTHRMTYRITKAMDPSRPVIDASGGMHYETDLFDVHIYEQDPRIFADCFEPMKNDPDCFHGAMDRYRPADVPARTMEYHGQPYWVSEYGGTFWNPDLKEGDPGWGYGKAPKTEEEFVCRYEQLTEVLLSHPRICGFCYTQLTDIEQEQNGLYRYDRSRKHPDWVYDRIRKVNQQIAAVENAAAE